MGLRPLVRRRKGIRDGALVLCDELVPTLGYLGDLNTLRRGAKVVNGEGGAFKTYLLSVRHEIRRESDTFILTTELGKLIQIELPVRLDAVGAIGLGGRDTRAPPVRPETVPIYHR